MPERIGPGHTVLLLDPHGHPVRAAGRMVRGVVVSVDERGQVAIVALSGCLMSTCVRNLRRCPRLVYCRPVRLVTGSAS
jgi:hypothetical protein